MWPTHKNSQLTLENLAQHNELYEPPAPSPTTTTTAPPPTTVASPRNASTNSNRIKSSEDLSTPLTGTVHKRGGLVPEMFQYSKAPTSSEASHCRACCIECSCCSAADPFLMSCCMVAFEATVLCPCYCAYKTRCRRRGAWRCCWCPAESENARRWHAQYPIGCWD